MMKPSKTPEPTAAETCTLPGEAPDPGFAPIWIDRAWMIEIDDTTLGEAD